MTNDALALPARAHLWTVDAVLGLSLALMAFTVAQAALPAPPVHTRPPVVAVAAVPQAVAAPPVAAAPELIAFQAPLPGRSIGSPFGRRQMPWEENGRLHAGVDIAADSGQAILASADGVVTRVSQDSGYGRFVEIKHAEGLTTLYAHMGRFAPGVAPGVAVKAGATVGLVGSSGSSSGPHLHFEVRDARDRPMNPEMFLGHSFAEASDLPLKAALRMPRGTRVAFVSAIPASKQALMQARLDPRSATGPRPDSKAVAAAIEASLATPTMVVDQVAGRPHARISAVFSPKGAEAPRLGPTG